MREPRHLLRPLREADALLSRTTLSPGARRRTRAELDREPRRRARLLAPVAWFAGGVTATLIAWRLLAAPAPDSSTVAAPAGFAWEPPACSATDAAGVVHLDGVCHLRVAAEAFVMTSRDHTQVVPLRDGVRVIRGNAEFEVAHVPGRARPVRVVVSAGAIEVVGTRFVVQQDEGHGHVDLLDGTIRFVAADGAVTTIAPGARFSWTDPTPARAPAPITGAPPPPAPVLERGAPARHVPKRGVDPTEIQRIHALRTGRRYREALELVNQLLVRAGDARTAEVLSFERGDLLELLQDTHAACAHWRRHQARFPNGSYHAAVAGTWARLGCR